MHTLTPPISRAGLLRSSTCRMARLITVGDMFVRTDKNLRRATFFGVDCSLSWLSAASRTALLQLFLVGCGRLLALISCQPRSRRHRRQPNHERRSAARPRHHLDRPVMLIDNPARDRKAQPGAARLAPRRIDAVKPLENKRNLLLLHAQPRITNPQTDAILLRRRQRRQLHFASRRILESIFDENE